LAEVPAWHGGLDSGRGKIYPTGGGGIGGVQSGSRFGCESEERGNLQEGAMDCGQGIKKPRPKSGIITRIRKRKLHFRRSPAKKPANPLRVG
jgi:hypothetical protein